MKSITRMAIGFLLTSTAAYSATVTDLQRYDFNKNGRIDLGRELDVYILHQNNQLLAKYDENNNGALDPQELSKLQRELAIVSSPVALAKAGALKDEAARRGGIPLADLAKETPSKSTECDPATGFYLRRDKLDISAYNQSVSQSAAKGASISYTDDRQTDTQIAQIQAVASYVIARDPCAKRPKGINRRGLFASGYAIAPYVAAQGQLSSNRATEKSALKGGIDFEVELFSGGFFDAQYLTASPYYQTDFRGLAAAHGFTGSWQPYKLDWRLGGSYTRFSNFVDFFWQAKADATFLRVDEKGLTNLVTNTHYAWYGGQARLNIFPFPDLFNNRLALVGTYDYYRDGNSGKHVNLTTAAVSYNLDAASASSLAIEYRTGEERDTLERVKKYLLSLNLKY